MKKRTKELQRTVCLVGAGPGAGVTHTGILLAEFLEERRGARTLFLEANNHKDIACLRKDHLSADYESLHEKRIEDLRLENYDYIIADMGTNMNFWQEGLFGHVKGVLIGSGAPWRQERFCQMVCGMQRAMNTTIEGERIEWKGMLSLGSFREAVRLSEQLGIPVVALGWQPLYEALSEKNEDLFLHLLQGGR